MASTSGSLMAEEQTRLLEEALGVVRQQSILMRKCLETPGKLMDALKCGSTLVSELRTPSLGPKQYYELYMAVFDALRYLSVYLKESHPVNHLADLYELVQYAGNIVPRLYLMITVGTVYMGIEDAPVKEIMKDMMEMCRGVQHPVRGLFLRYYLLGQAKDHLPTTETEGPEGNLSDSISFVLTNFVEMNKLWVRLQHQGHSRERAQRTQERKELELLVGSNLVRLSQLVTLDTYRNVILQPLLEQVVQCRDVLAQEYLLEVVTKVFPDEFHLNTLDILLPAIGRLNPNVDLKKIVIGLMDRLSSYALRDSESNGGPEERQKMEEEAVTRLLNKLKIPEEDKKEEKEPAENEATEKEADETSQEKEGETADEETTAEEKPEGEAETETAPAEKEEKQEPEKPIEEEKPSTLLNNIRLYEIFYEQVVSLVRARNLSIQDTMALLVSLANLSLNIYPSRIEYIDQVFGYAASRTSENFDSADLHSAPAQTNILNLLLAPVRSYASIFTALALPNYAPLFHAQSYPTRRAVAGEIARSILRNKAVISSQENLGRVMDILKVLITEGLQQAVGYPAIGQQRRGETDETIEEQGWLARLVHYIQGPDNDTQLELLRIAYKAYLQGNERIKFVTAPIITQAIKLARAYKKREHFDDNWQSQSASLYRFMHNVINSLYQRSTPNSADLALRLFILCGQTADQLDFEEYAYEFFAQAFTIYEDSISDSRAQFQAISVIAGALHGTRNFSKDNYDTLITKVALHGSKLLKKPDQCRAVYLASHLWWAVENPARGEEDAKNLYRDGKRVLECLQRALRVADACMDPGVSIELFIEILNRYVYYFDQGNESVTTKYVNGLIELIHSNLATSEGEGVAMSSLENPRRHFQRTLEYIRSREYEGVVTDPKV